MPAANNTLSNCYVPILSESSYIKAHDGTLGSSSSNKNHQHHQQSSSAGTKKDGEQMLISNKARSTSHVPICPSHRPSGSSSSLSSDYRTASPYDTYTLIAIFYPTQHGSAIVELGHTKVICNVQGPRPLSTSTSSQTASGGDGFAITSGRLHCQIRYAPNFAMNMQRSTMAQACQLDKFSSAASSSSGSNASLNAQETELSLKLHDALAPSLPMHLFMKNVVDVFVLVLQDDGAVLPACLMAASLALADSGVEVYDLFSSFSIAVVARDNTVLGLQQHDQDAAADDDESMLEEGKMEERCGISKADDKYHLLADPDANEILIADGVLTIGMMSNWKEVVFWDQTGRLPSKVVSEAIELCKEGCLVMHNFMREALVGQKDRK
eukprot:CAMPEP_0176501754 /NCGR_PEP_ID=MMETSP0200_2-20121128/14346_1 /TAXON_ID=947934 /ORGANISM="Chaetoceros sp., Strain GSL56" /LENGTH=381 /DNA_ID=CAMNT_0017900695 /DNA_START=47 /DNA_END=1193 /DNA_ORIENTATION=+